MRLEKDVARAKQASISFTRRQRRAGRAVPARLAADGLFALAARGLKPPAHNLSAVIKLDVQGGDAITGKVPPYRSGRFRRTHEQEIAF
jgi:hypothetical protein